VNAPTESAGRPSAAVIGVCGLIAGVVVVPWLLAWGSLPDPVATHWNLGGDPDGSSAPAVAVAILAGPAVALAAVAVATSRRAGRTAGVAALTPVIVFTATVLAVASAATAVANAGTESWRDARLPIGWAVAFVVVPALAAFAVARASRQAGSAPAPADPPLPRVALRAGQRLAWIGSSTSVWAAPACCVCLAVGIGALVLGGTVLGVVFLLTASVLAAFTSVRVSIGEGGLRAATPLGWPRVTIPLDRISAAEAVDINPIQWGGWGYRGSLHLFGRAAWVLRRGPGLRVDLTDGTTFAVTVDDATEAVAALNGLVARPAT
jgi:Protein of unknown function (DUF1648)